MTDPIVHTMQNWGPMRKCSACVAKDEHISSLQEQIEWLRLHSGTPILKEATGNLPVREHMWLSEEEEELAAMKQAGIINSSDLEDALRQVGAMNTEIELEA